MKENAQRILSWLYPSDKAVRWVRSEEFGVVAPDLTDGGLQSVLLFLQKRKRVVIERLEGQQLVSITTHGMRALEEQIPAFVPQRRTWQGDWQGIFFLRSPRSDQHFRFLRRLLTNGFALPVSRGVFLYPGKLPEKIIFELNSGYEGAVLVAEFKNWSFGDEKELISEILALSDMINTYSGISKEIDKLLTLDQSLIEFTDQAKLRFSSVFDRLFTTLKNDYGIQQAYFPQEKTGIELLFALQKLSFLE
ncbi:MAG TPA: hypothetical protein VGA89_00565 [Patescibacteria group bacterium]|jgi:hypothetical protein